MFAAHDFLADALAKGTLSHEDFGLARITEEIGVRADGSPELEFWYDGQPELTPEGRAKIEALPGGRKWLDGMAGSRLEIAAHAEFLVRKGVHYEMDAGKIAIIDQAEHGLQRNPKTSSESRWSAEPGKASLAQAVEAKEIRAAEARGVSAEQHRIVVRADAESAKRLNAAEIYRVGGEFFDEVTGASGTLADLNPVLGRIYGLAEAHEVGRSQTHRLMEGQHDVVESTHAKLSTVAEYAHEMRQGGEGRFQEILCHRNDLVQRQVEALVRAGVPRDAIEAVDAKRILEWGADWETELQKVFDEAGEQGKILVINRQGQRGVDISVSEAVKAKGGMHVWMTEAPEQSYIHEQAKNRTARNGDRGSAQVVMSTQDALIRNAMHLRGVREAVVHYEQAVAAHNADPTPQTHDAVVAASHAIREMTPELQQRALRHSTANFIRHHAFSTDNHTLTLAAADTGLYGEPDFTRPDEPADQATRLAGLLVIPAPAVANQIAELERNGAIDPVRELLNRAGIAPASAEALRQHVEATAPAKALERAGLSDVDALIEIMPLRNRLADELGVPIADIGGAEGMRMLDPLLTEARDALAAALGYPAAGITPVIARDILGEAVGDHLTATNTGQFAVGNDIDSAAVVSGPVSRDAQDPDVQAAAARDADAQNADTRDVADGAAEDIIAAASQYLATATLLDLVVQIHRRSPNSCVNNAVTGMRVLCPDNARRFEMPATTLRGHGRDAVRKVFGAGLEKAESLDQVAESLQSRPGGINVLVYKWKDTRATGSVDANDHMVLLVNDSDSVAEPNLVVVDLAASRDGDPANDYGPKDLRNRRALLNKAVAFDDWRREQQKFIDRVPVDRRLFETIEFDRDGNLVAGSRMGPPTAENLAPSQQVVVPDATVDEIVSISAELTDLGAAVPVRPGTARDGSNDPRRDERSPVGSRPHEGHARDMNSDAEAVAAADEAAIAEQSTEDPPHIRLLAHAMLVRQPVNIARLAADAQIVLFGETHTNPAGRAFLEQQAAALRAVGVTHYGIEAPPHPVFDALNARKQVDLSGIRCGPGFGNWAETVKAMAAAGITIVPFDVEKPSSPSGSPLRDVRESHMARVITETMRLPGAKMAILVGLDHLTRQQRMWSDVTGAYGISLAQRLTDAGFATTTVAIWGGQPDGPEVVDEVAHRLGLANETFLADLEEVNRADRGFGSWESDVLLHLGTPETYIVQVAPGRPRQPTKLGYQEAGGGPSWLTDRSAPVTPNRLQLTTSADQHSTGRQHTVDTARADIRHFVADWANPDQARSTATLGSDLASMYTHVRRGGKISATKSGPRGARTLRFEVSDVGAVAPTPLTEYAESRTTWLLRYLAHRFGMDSRPDGATTIWFEFDEAGPAFSEFALAEVHGTELPDTNAAPAPQSTDGRDHQDPRSRAESGTDAKNQPGTEADGRIDSRPSEPGANLRRPDPARARPAVAGQPPSTVLELSPVVDRAIDANGDQGVLAERDDPGARAQAELWHRVIAGAVPPISDLAAVFKSEKEEVPHTLSGTVGAQPGISLPGPESTAPEVVAELPDRPRLKVISATPHHDLNTLLSRVAYHDDDGWTGGDSTYMRRLPDGRYVIMFSDTFLGRVQADGSRSLDTPFVSNSFVEIDHSGRARTILSETPDGQVRAVMPPHDGEFYWLGGSHVTSRNTLDVLFLRFTGDVRVVDTGGDFDAARIQTAMIPGGNGELVFKGNVLIRFDAGDLSRIDVTPMPSETSVHWASWMEFDARDDYTYIYGVEDEGAEKFMHIARVKGDDLRQPWQFLGDAGKWSPREADSVRVMSGVANEYSVSRLPDGHFLLVTQDTTFPYSADIMGYLADSPTGPFISPTLLYRATEPGPFGFYRDADTVVYNAHEQPDLRRGNQIVVTYNTNGSVRGVFADTSKYRPNAVKIRFDIEGLAAGATGQRSPQSPASSDVPGTGGVDYSDPETASSRRASHQPSTATVPNGQSDRRRSQGADREKDGDAQDYIGRRPHENVPEAWARLRRGSETLPQVYARLQRGSSDELAESDRLRELLLDPRQAPLREHMLTREIELLRAGLPERLLETATRAERETIHRALRLAAMGLHAAYTLYGGDPDMAQDGEPAVNRIVGDLEKPEHGTLAAYHNGDGILRSLARLRQHLDNLVVAGVPINLQDRLDAMVGEVYSDIVYGNGRKSDNASGYDELRSAELVKAHARHLGYQPQQIERLGRIVLGTTFDERTGRQVGRLDPDPVVQAVAGIDLDTLSEYDALTDSSRLSCEDNMSARYPKGLTLSRAINAEIEHINSFIADPGERSRAEVLQLIRGGLGPSVAARLDQNPDWQPTRPDTNRLRPQSTIEILEFIDAGPAVAKRAYADRLLANVKFLDPESGYHYPPTWTLENTALRAEHRDFLRNMASRLLHEDSHHPEYLTAVEFHNETKRHAVRMRAKYMPQKEARMAPSHSRIAESWTNSRPSINPASSLLARIRTIDADPETTARAEQKALDEYRERCYVREHALGQEFVEKKAAELRRQGLPANSVEDEAKRQVDGYLCSEHAQVLIAQDALAGAADWLDQWLGSIGRTPGRPTLGTTPWSRRSGHDRPGPISEFGTGDDGAGQSPEQAPDHDDGGFIGSRPTEHELRFAGVSHMQYRDMIEQRIPLGFSRDLWEECVDHMRRALELDRITDADVRLFGTSSKFYSATPGKTFPQTVDEMRRMATEFSANLAPEEQRRHVDNAVRSYREAGYDNDEPKPEKAFFDSRYRLGLDSWPSGYDFQLCSDILASRFEDLARREEIEIYTKGDWYSPYLLGRVAPELQAWVQHWERVQRRWVSVATYPGSKANVHADSGDWIVIRPESLTTAVRVDTETRATGAAEERNPQSTTPSDPGVTARNSSEKIEKKVRYADTNAQVDAEIRRAARTAYLRAGSITAPRCAVAELTFIRDHFDNTPVEVPDADTIAIIENFGIHPRELAQYAHGQYVNLTPGDETAGRTPLETLTSNIENPARPTALALVTVQYPGASGDRIDGHVLTLGADDTGQLWLNELRRNPDNTLALDTDGNTIDVSLHGRGAHDRLAKLNREGTKFFAITYREDGQPENPLSPDDNWTNADWETAPRPQTRIGHDRSDDSIRHFGDIDITGAPENYEPQPDKAVSDPAADRAAVSAARRTLAELLSVPVNVVAMGAVRSAVDAVQRRIAEAPDDVLAAMDTSQLIAWISESLDLHRRVEMVTRKSANTDSLPPDRQDRLEQLRRAFVTIAEALARRLDRMFGSDPSAPLAALDSDAPLRELRRLAGMSKSPQAAALVAALAHYFADAPTGDPQSSDLSNPELAAAAIRYRDLLAGGFTGKPAQKDVAKVAGVAQSKVSRVLRRAASDITAEERIILVAAQWLGYPLPEDLGRAAAHHEYSPVPAARAAGIARRQDRTPPKSYSTSLDDALDLPRGNATRADGAVVVPSPWTKRGQPAEGPFAFSTPPGGVSGVGRSQSRSEPEIHPSAESAPENEADLEAEIGNRLAALGIKTRAALLIEASLSLEEKFLGVAIIAGQPRPEVIFGKRRWAGHLGARLVARQHGNQELTVDFILELDRALALAENLPKSREIPEPRSRVGILYSELTPDQITAIDENPLLVYLSPPAGPGDYGVIKYPDFDSPEDLRRELQALCDWYNAAKRESNYDPYELAASLRRWFVSIHPVEHNGQASRILMNWSLEQDGRFASAVREFDSLPARLSDWVAMVRAGSLRYGDLIAKLGERGPTIDPVALFGYGQQRENYREMNGEIAPFAPGQPRDRVKYTRLWKLVTSGETRPETSAAINSPPDAATAPLKELHAWAASYDDRQLWHLLAEKHAALTARVSTFADERTSAGEMVGATRELGVYVREALQRLMTRASLPGPVPDDAGGLLDTARTLTDHFPDAQELHAAARTLVTIHRALETEDAVAPLVAPVGTTFEETAVESAADHNPAARAPVREDQAGTDSQVDAEIRRAARTAYLRAGSITDPRCAVAELTFIRDHFDNTPAEIPDADTAVIVEYTGFHPRELAQYAGGQWTETTLDEITARISDPDESAHLALISIQYPDARDDHIDGHVFTLTTDHNGEIRLHELVAGLDGRVTEQDLSGEDVRPRYAQLRQQQREGATFHAITYKADGVPENRLSTDDRESSTDWHRVPAPATRLGRAEPGDDSDANTPVVSTSERGEPRIPAQPTSGSKSAEAGKDTAASKSSSDMRTPQQATDSPSIGGTLIPGPRQHAAMSTQSDPRGDVELMAAVRNGDTEAFGTLFERHIGAVRGYARSRFRPSDADDLVSHAFLATLAALRKGLGPESSFRAYVLTVLRRHALAQKLGYSDRITLSPDLTEYDVSEEQVEGREHALLEQALAPGTLSERARLILANFDLPVAELARLIEAPSANAANVARHRAVEELRAAYLQAQIPPDSDESCRDTVEKLGTWVRGPLRGRAENRVNAHLQGCSSCRATLQVLVALNPRLAVRTRIPAVACGDGRSGGPAGKPAPTDREGGQPNDPATPRRKQGGARRQRRGTAPRGEESFDPLGGVANDRAPAVLLGQLDNPWLFFADDPRGGDNVSAVRPRDEDRLSAWQPAGRVEDALSPAWLRGVHAAITAEQFDADGPLRAHLGRILTHLNKLMPGAAPGATNQRTELETFGRAVGRWLDIAHTELDDGLSAGQVAHNVTARQNHLAEATHRYRAATEALAYHAAKVDAAPANTSPWSRGSAPLDRVDIAELAQTVEGLATESARLESDSARAAEVQQTRHAWTAAYELWKLAQNPRSVPAAPRVEALISYADAARSWLMALLDRKNSADLLAQEQRIAQVVDEYRQADRKVRELLRTLEAQPVAAPGTATLGSGELPPVTLSEAQSPAASASADRREPWLDLPPPAPHKEVDLGHAAGVTDVGRRNTNQDDFAIATAVINGERVTLAAVCDGASGEAIRSDRAAAVGSAAAGAVLEQEAAAVVAGRTWDPATVLAKATQAAQDAVLDLISREFPDCNLPPESTIVLSLVTSTQLFTECAGDSRAYWIPLDGGPAVQLTTDDSALQSYMDLMGLSAEQAARMPHASSLLRGLGVKNEWREPNPTAHQMTGRGVVALVSDGPIKKIGTPDAIADQVRTQLTRTSGNLLAAARGFATAAVDAGSRDNVTVVLITRPDRTDRAGSPPTAAAASPWISPTPTGTAKPVDPRTLPWAGQSRPGDGPTALAQPSSPWRARPAAEPTRAAGSTISISIGESPVADSPTPRAPAPRPNGVRRQPASGATPPTRNEIADALGVAPRRVDTDVAIGAVPGCVTPWTVTRFNPGESGDPE
ncbi:sigma factor [Nocardia sp. SC052]|uniref:sigma factor n=1 Tax=Nocardia sichangensis TaxID=3385975 RepID=UPI0039A3335C